MRLSIVTAVTLLVLACGHLSHGVAVRQYEPLPQQDHAMELSSSYELSPHEIRVTIPPSSHGALPSGSASFDDQIPGSKDERAKLLSMDLEAGEPYHDKKAQSVINNIKAKAGKIKDQVIDHAQNAHTAVVNASDKIKDNAIKHAQDARAAVVAASEKIKAGITKWAPGNAALVTSALVIIGMDTVLRSSSFPDLFKDTALTQEEVNRMSRLISSMVGGTAGYIVETAATPSRRTYSPPYYL
ncbi:hypothetical protein THASP1DRAFT_33554 [Thamnocephalis sphaerospora]|uniref:Uncharacterized protein n=1 Tax=Thamnocephalis sphaerospora TaxID=78915 RepID=A0A4P9XG93_9FUNG|nr:hypothetical protein THASP1DRAFT_33554 [Thamnocephalis sphaerospora]|eukprot:RKP04655.1 hypothetical protein THASP1DRAFT_33554 [Thamnocephalis sphaerospora]